jgi:hypothetical protein
VDKYPENLCFVLVPVRALNKIFSKTKLVSFDMKKWSSIREGLNKIFSKTKLVSFDMKKWSSIREGLRHKVHL